MLYLCLDYDKKYIIVLISVYYLTLDAKFNTHS